MSNQNPVPDVDKKEEKKEPDARVVFIASQLGNKTYKEIFNTDLQAYTNRVFFSNTSSKEKLHLNSIGRAEAELAMRLKSKYTSQLPVIDRETMKSVFNILKTIEDNFIEGEDFKKLIGPDGKGKLLTVAEQEQIKRQTLVGYVTRISALLFLPKGDEMEVNRHLNAILTSAAGEYTRKKITNSDDLYNSMIEKHQNYLANKKIADTFKEGSLESPENKIKNILSDLNYHILGEFGKQLLQSKINELPFNPSRIAIQVEFNKQALSTPQEKQAANQKLQEAIHNLPQSPDRSAMETEFNKALGVPEVVLAAESKKETSPNRTNQTQGAEFKTQGTSVTSIFASIKTAVTGAWNFARESTRGKPDTTSKNEGGAKAGSQVSSGNVDTTNAATSSKGILNSIKSAAAGAWDFARERMRGNPDATSMNVSLTQSATGGSVKVDAIPSAPPSESKKSGSWFSRAMTFISSTIGYNRADNNNISISAPSIPPGQNFADTTSPPNTSSISAKHNATSTSGILNRLSATADYKSDPESKSLPQRLKEIEDLFDKELIMMTSLHENFARTMSVDSIVECINSVHKETPSVDGERRQLVMKTLENMQRKIEAEIIVAPIDSSQSTALKQIRQEGFYDKGIPHIVIEKPSEKTVVEPSPEYQRLGSFNRSAP